MILILKALTAALLIVFGVGAALVGCTKGTARRTGAGRKRFHRPDPKGALPETIEERRLMALTPEYLMDDLARKASDDAWDYVCETDTTPADHRRQVEGL